MAQRLYLVFGGELIDPSKNAFKDVNDIHMPSFDTHIHRLRDEEAAASSTEELG